MPEPIIRVENLGKKYRIRHTREGKGRYQSFRDVLTDGVRSLGSRLTRSAPSETDARSTEDFWALKDVSFDVQQGEVVGIIGRNGAGKSTLLKILSRITEPTTGRITLNGRVASLLEVGTGFHPELTGRENVYLNGAILGMSRSEIARKFDEIVAFAETEKFLDTPVKHYSSGMYMRLAFAVAAHLEPEILIVDEVLAVGDAEFQKKCLGKMGEVARGGRTVLFVSHNMASIRQLCTRLVLLKSGRIASRGDPAEVIQKYYEDTRTGHGGDLSDWKDRDREANGKARILRFDVLATNAEIPGCVKMGRSLRMSMDVEFREKVTDPTFGVLIHSILGEPLLDIRSMHSSEHVGIVKGVLRIETFVPSLALYPGEYLLSAWVADRSQLRNMDWAKNVYLLLISPPEQGSDDLKKQNSWGKYWIPSQWTFCSGAPVS